LNGGSPAPSLPHANAEAGPSRHAAHQQHPSNASSSRVLAPWGKSKSYYPATVTEIVASKANTYAIDFDDEDTSTAVLSALRKCIFRAGDVLTFDKAHYVVAKGQEDGEPLQKGDTVRAYKKSDSSKKIKAIPIERVTVQAAFAHQFSDRTVVASDLLLRPSARSAGGTRAATRPPSVIPSTASSSSRATTNNTGNKGKGRGGRTRTSIEGIAFPTGRGSFQGIAFVLTNCHDPSSLKKTILSNGGTVGEDIDSFWSVGGIKSAAKMRDQEYECAELKWNEELEEGELKTVLLIADGPSRKPKMMKAAALGVPCVSRKWVEVARAEVSRVVFYLPFDLTSSRVSLSPFVRRLSDFPIVSSSSLLLLEQKTVHWISYLLPKPRSFYHDLEDVQTQAILDAWGKDPNALYDPVNYSDHRERPFDGLRILCHLKTDVERVSSISLLHLLFFAISSSSRHPPLSLLFPRNSSASALSPWVLPASSSKPIPTASSSTQQTSSSSPTTATRSSPRSSRRTVTEPGSSTSSGFTRRSSMVSG